jgi:hypothetical protein
MKNIHKASPKSRSILTKLKPLLFVVFALPFCMGIASAGEYCRGSISGESHPDNDRPEVYHLHSTSIEGNPEGGELISCLYHGLPPYPEPLVEKTVKSSDYEHNPKYLEIKPDFKGSTWTRSEDGSKWVCERVLPNGDRQLCSFDAKDAQGDPVGKLFPYEPF